MTQFWFHWTRLKLPAISCPLLPHGTAFSSRTRLSCASRFSTCSPTAEAHLPLRGSPAHAKGFLKEVFTWRTSAPASVKCCAIERESGSAQHRAKKKEKNLYLVRSCR